jgi:hypothetical protein
MAGVGHGVLPPPRLVLGIDREEEKVRGKGADRRVPRGSETRRKMKGRRAGWLWWAERVGGLAVW